MGEWRYRFIILDLGTRRRSASRLDRLNPGQISAVINWIWGWVFPKAGLDPMEYRKISAGNQTPAFQTVAAAIPTELSRLLESLRTAEKKSVKPQL
jgi:hypothetical protein